MRVVALTGGRDLSRGTAARLMALGLLLAGGAVWVFPASFPLPAPQWLPMVISVAALLVAVVLACEWPLVRAALVLLAISLLVGWSRACSLDSSHLFGAALGLLAMTAVGRTAATPYRLRVALVALLAAGLGVLLVGLAATSADEVSLAGEAVQSVLPRIKLELAGVVGGDVNPNALSAVVLLVLPLALSVLAAWRDLGVERFLALPLAASVVLVSVVALAVCESRSALVAIWLIAVGALVIGTRPPLRRIVAGLVVVAPLFAVSVSIFSMSQDAFQEFAGKIWHSAHSRAPILEQGALLFSGAPWFGIGLNAFRRQYDLGGVDIAHAHNMFLQTALDVGVIGSLAYWSLVALLLYSASDTARRSRGAIWSAASGAALSLIAVTLFGIADAVPLGTKVGTLQWIAGGLILASGRLARTGSAEGRLGAVASAVAVPSGCGDHTIGNQST